MTYCGARGRIDLAAMRELGSGWMLQPKIDGMYAKVHTDCEGRIRLVQSRSGGYISSHVHQLSGLYAGPADAVLVGEVEAHTERGRSAAAARGAPGLHLFDALRIEGHDLADQPHQRRRDALYRSCLEADARLLIVPQVAAVYAHKAWHEWVELEQHEGLVAVARQAPAGSRRAKLKCKPIDTIDAGVVATDSKRVVLRYDGRIFVVGRGQLDPKPGELWEVAHEGWYGAGDPRFARLVRRRDDIVSLCAIR